MKKYIALIVVSFLLIVGLALGVYLWLNSKNAATADAIEAIPSDASIIVKIEDFAKFHSSISQNKAWQTLSAITTVNSFASTSNYFDSLRESNSLVKELLQKNHIYFAVFAEPSGKSNFLFAAKRPEHINPSDLYSFAKLQAIGLYKEDEKFYNQSQILTFRNNRSEINAISLTVTKGIVLASNSPLLIEKAVSQLEEGVSLTQNKQFLKISKTAGSHVDANVFVNVTRLPELLNLSVNEKYKNGVNSLEDIAEWIELDLNLSGNNLVMAGLSSVSDSLNSYLRILSKQKPVKMDAPSIIPSEAGAFVWLGISNLDVYFDSYRSYLDRKGEIFDYTQQLTILQKKLGIEPQEFFKKLIDEELGIVFLPSISPSDKNEWFIISKTYSASSSKQLINSAVNHYEKGLGNVTSTNPTLIKIDKEKTFEVLPMPVSNLYSGVFGGLFNDVPVEYYCFIDNWLVLGSSPKSLERFLSANIRNNVLRNNNAFKRYSSELSPKSNQLIFINPSVIGKTSDEFLSSGNFYNGSLSGIDGISYQLVGGTDLIFNTLTIKSGEQVVSATKRGAWETKLDATPISKPFVVANHITKEKEIFVQDSENAVYLINSAGRVLWKRQIDAAIMGDVVQVDLFKNRKLQLAFNTPNKLYIIDRNGKDVSGFPINYKTTATNPMSVIDYDGNREYRFFQATSDRKIYVFDSAGKQVKGWNFGRTETMVNDRIGYVRMNGMDYIVVFDSNRPYILNRKGDERVKVNKHFAKAPNSSFTLGSSEDGKPYIITTDTIGLVRKIFLNGDVQDEAFKPFSKWHTFIHQDINGDGKKDYIFQENKTIYAYNSDKTSLFEVSIKGELKPLLLFFDFGGDNKIGLVDDKSSKIYLINNKGKILESYPIDGSTPFSISPFSNKKNTMNLLVGTKQGSVINYDLD